MLEHGIGVDSGNWRRFFLFCTRLDFISMQEIAGLMGRGHPIATNAGVGCFWKLKLRSFLH